MPYTNQEKKAKIAAQLKKVIPPTWKWSLGVEDHSTIRLIISAAPVDLFHRNLNAHKWNKGYIQVNESHLETEYGGELLLIFKAIRNALNIDNFDLQTDYFCVGHYVSLHIGRWDKPFQLLGAKESPEEELARLKGQLAAIVGATSEVLNG